MMLGFLLAVLDLAVGVVVAALTVRWWFRAAGGHVSWPRVAALTSAYVLYVNVVAKVVPFTPSAYLLILATMFWDAVLGAGSSARPLQAYSVSTLLLASWLPLAGVPSLVIEETSVGIASAGIDDRP